MSKFELPYERRILPYLLQPPASSGGEFWLTGSDGSCTVHPDLVASLFTVVQTTSSLIVPDAPVFALKQLAQLLHRLHDVLQFFETSLKHHIVKK